MDVQEFLRKSLEYLPVRKEEVRMEERQLTGTGYDFYEFERGFVVKVPKHKKSEEFAEKEYESLKRLEQNFSSGEFRAPRVIAYNRDSKILAMERIYGTNLKKIFKTSLTLREVEELYRKSGEFLKQVHEKVATDIRKGTKLRGHEKYRYASDLIRKRKIDVTLDNWLHARYNKVCFCQGDPSPVHFFYEEIDGEGVLFLIDYNAASINPPALDLGHYVSNTLWHFAVDDNRPKIAEKTLLKVLEGYTPDNETLKLTPFFAGVSCLIKYKIAKSEDESKKCLDFAKKLLEMESITIEELF